MIIIMSNFNPATMNPAAIVLDNTKDSNNINILLILIIILAIIILVKVN